MLYFKGMVSLLGKTSNLELSCFPAEVISSEEANLRDEAYAKDGKGCFLYYLDNSKSIW